MASFTAGGHTWADANDLTLVANKNSQASGGTVTGTWLDMRGYEKGVAIIHSGTPISSGTVKIDAQVRQATDSSGTSAKALSGGSISTFNATVSAGAKSVIEFDTAKLDHANSFYFATVQIKPTNSGTASVSAWLVRAGAHTEPVGNSNLDEAVQVLAN